jgi:hypothetical protein
MRLVGLVRDQQRQPAHAPVVAAHHNKDPE